ncbi:MAG: methyltransferase domain-containing protein [bacterium]
MNPDAIPGREAPAPAAPFREFARHYDSFMHRYVDYRSWVDYVERIFSRFRARPRTVLDLACGTGIPSLLLARRGYRVTGVDRSEEMLVVLRQKAGGLPVTAVRADITDFALEEPADAAISLYDSINYLLTEEALSGCFRCTRQSLRPGGLFVFDMNTVHALAAYWGNRLTPRAVGAVQSVWENRYDPATRVSTLRLRFREPSADGRFLEFEEEHRERAYTRQELKRNLQAAGFEHIKFFSHGGFLPVGPLTVRMMVVAR